jgi:hypothetical protein
MASPRIKPGRMSKTGLRPYLEALTAPFVAAATRHPLQGYFEGRRAIELCDKSRAWGETPRF